MKPINVLSLFDGMSCGQIALDRLGIPVENYFASEVDKWAIQITQKNYPDTIQLGDVIRWQDWHLPKIDLLLGGSPCQGFSIAGKRLNWDDPRSLLFFKYVDCLRWYKPKYFLFENVARMKKEVQDAISFELGVEPVRINSNLVSAQNRDRLYWTNIPNIMQPKDKEIYWKDVYEENADCFYYTDKSFAWINKSSKRRKRYYEYKLNDEINMQMLEKSHYKGYSNQRCFGIRDMRGVRYISPIECERLQTIDDNYTEGVSNTQRYKMLGNGWTVDVIYHILRKAMF